MAPSASADAVAVARCLIARARDIFDAFLGGGIAGEEAVVDANPRDVRKIRAALDAMDAAAAAAATITADGNCDGSAAGDATKDTAGDREPEPAVGAASVDGTIGNEAIAVKLSSIFDKAPNSVGIEP